MTSIQQRDAQSVLAGIDDLLPRIANRSQAAEELRRLPDETVTELDEVGFFKLLQPEQSPPPERRSVKGVEKP